MMEYREIYDCLLKLIEMHIQEGSLPKRLQTMALQPDTRLDELGLDSISQVVLLTGLMNMADSYFPDSLFLGNPSLREIARRVHENLDS